MPKPTKPKRSPIDAWMKTAEIRLLQDVIIHQSAKTGPMALNSLHAPIDEENFLNICNYHRLEPLVHKTLISPNRHLFSTKITKTFDQIARNARLSHLALSSAVKKISRSFKEADIQHVFLKGPLLSETIFPGEALRYSNDLDVLIKRENLFRADSSLRNLGYFPADPKRALENRSTLSIAMAKDLIYRTKQLSQPLELHWKTHIVENLLNQSGFDLEKATLQQAFFGGTVPVLNDLNNFLYLCFHASKHNWSRLRWLLDIHLFAKQKNLDWSKCLEHAKKFRLRTPVLEAATLISTFLKTALPLPVSPEVSSKILWRFHIMHDPERTKLDAIGMYLAQGNLYDRGHRRTALQIYNMGNLLWGYWEHRIKPQLDRGNS